MKNVAKNKFLNQHPLDVWKSEHVMRLLIEFFRVNFEKAGVLGESAEEYILKAWKERESKDKEILRQECDDFFEKVKNDVKNPPDEVDPIDLFDFSNVDTFLDIGANKLSTINYLAERNKRIKKFIAVDIIPQRKEFVDPARGTYYQIDEGAKSFPVPDKSMDFINIQFVFHHFRDLGSIKKTLEICRNSLKPGGSLLLWEESFADKYDPNLVGVNNNLGIKTGKTLTEKFYALNRDMRWEFIVVNDWLINVNNPHMPWTGQYYRWREWANILENSGFALEKEYNFGLRINGRIKQGVHMLGMFKNK